MNERQTLNELHRVCRKVEADRPTEQNFKPNHSYFAHHNPTGEDWYILGIDTDGDRVCAAGWPHTIAKLSDCSAFEVNKPLTEEELAHRKKRFGTNWL